MATQNILPSLQADEKTAHLGVRSVHIPNGMLETGRMLTDAGQGLQRASFGLALGLKRQRDEMNAREDALALAEAKNAYSNDMTKHVTELMQKSGTEARGITGQFDTFSDNAFNRWQSGLSPRAAREFKIWADQQHLSGWQRVQGHELSNVKGAQVEQGNQGLTNDIQMFSVHGDYRTLAMLDQDARAQYELLYGGSGDQESLDRYTQNLIDKAYGARLDYLIGQGLIDQATRFYNSMGQNGMPEASGAAREVMGKVLSDQQRELFINAKAIELNDTKVKIAGGDYSYGGWYPTEEAEVAFAEEYDKLLRSGTEEDRQTARVLSTIHQADLAVQRAHLAADKAQTLRDLRDWSDPYQAQQNLLQLQHVINKMGPSVLRDELIDEYTKYDTAIKREMKAREAEAKAEQRELRAEERQLIADWKEWKKEFKDDPERKGYVGLLKLRLGQSDATVRFGDAVYNMKSDEEFEQMLRDLSWRNNGYLTDDDVNDLRAQRRLGIASTERIDAADRVRRVLNELNDTDLWTGALASAAAPKLVDDVMEVVYRYTRGGKEGGKAIDEAINQVIYTKLAEERTSLTRLGTQSVTLAEWLGKGLDADGNLNADFDQKHFSWKFQNNEQRTRQTLREAGVPFNAQGGRSNYSMETQAAIMGVSRGPDTAAIERQEQAYARQEEIDEGYAIAHQAIEDGLDEAGLRHDLRKRWLLDRTGTPKPMVTSKIKAYKARIEEIVSYYNELKKQREGE